MCNQVRARSLAPLLLSVLALAPRATPAQSPVGPLPTITVTRFEYGASASRPPVDFRAHYPDRGGSGAGYAEAVGTGLADLVVQKLVESERFRVFERRQLDAVQLEHRLERSAADSLPRARYIVTGSVSHLGVNAKETGAVAAGLVMTGARFLGPFGSLAAGNVKHSSTSVRVTVRVVDSYSGEIIGSFTSEGTSKKRWGVTAAGMTGGGMAGARTQDLDFRDTALGEAASQAAADIAERVIAMRAGRLRP